MNNNLIEVFLNTKEISDSLPKLGKTTKYQFNNIKLGINREYEDNNIIVDNLDSVSALAKYSKFGRTCVLNMASPKRPGGGVANGARAQEESIFRCSNLCNLITTDFYPLKKDEALYTERAIFFKDFYYQMMVSIESDVVTIAAFNLNSEEPNDYIKETKSKIRLMCSLPNKHGAKVLILGAWGCGVFNNDPDVMSSLFKEILIDEGYASLYDKVIFAIINDHNSVSNNYSIFKNNLS